MKINLLCVGCCFDRRYFAPCMRLLWTRHYFIYTPLMLLLLRQGAPSPRRWYDWQLCLSKLEKVPRGIQGEKTWQGRGIWSQQLEQKQVPKRGMEPGVRKGKRSMQASHTRCKCSMETTHNSVKVKLGIKVMKSVESLIGWEVTVGQGSECHLTFVRGLLHIAE